jgi:hypothetical protein
MKNKTQLEKFFGQEALHLCPITRTVWSKETKPKVPSKLVLCIRPNNGHPLFRVLLTIAYFCRNRNPSIPVAIWKAP